MIRAFAALALGLMCALAAPRAQAQIPGLSVSPNADCVFVGPPGGPFSPNACAYTLSNSTGAAINLRGRVSVQFSPAWMSASVNGQNQTPNEDFNFSVPANGSVPVSLFLLQAANQVTSPSARGALLLEVPGSPQNQVSISGRFSFSAGNDNFADARVLTANDFTINGTTTGATKEPGEPNHAGNPGGASLWFRFTAPASGTLTLNTNFTGFDTLLAVYTGSAVNALTQVAANDDAPNSQGGVSAVSFPVTQGTTYHIALDGASRNGGPAANGGFNLTIIRNFTVGNDRFTDAVAINGAAGQVTQFAQSGVSPTRETDEPQHGGGNGGSVWYEWTPDATAVYRFTAGGSAPPSGPVIAVYLGSSVTQLTEVASTSIFAPTSASLDFTAIAGQRYRIALAGGSASAPYEVSWGLANPQPPLGLFASILPNSRAVGRSEIATVFANMVNTSQVAGQNCRPVPPNVLNAVTPNGFAYQTASAQNTLTGAPNTPVTIPAGATQNWVLQIQRGQLITNGRLGFRFVCDNLAAAPLFPLANSWILRILDPAPADVIAISATTGDPGVVSPPLGGSAAFAAAGVNIGTAAPITVTPSASVGGLSLSVCQTNAQGQCLAPPAPTLSIASFDEDEIRTFSVFVTSTGGPIPLDAGFSRVSLGFQQGPSLVGGTSVAVRTQ